MVEENRRVAEGSGHGHLEATVSGWLLLGAATCLQDVDVVVNLGAVTLRYAFCDPDDVAHFLLLQLDERVEDAEVELVQVGVHVQLHLQEKEG
ncbi:hypothetical protein L596_026003 [Steinernema carpocapsae]|uniref:Uncharacterized protein n=1 Tax=Steinernema carpocapsae TaxID=34508 RepID=A0A4U5M020_STECR|nr:hypothetical protein L596_026003 [Steinernema carpocapsae]